MFVSLQSKKDINMEQKEKDLLIRALACMVPYGLKFKAEDGVRELHYVRDEEVYSREFPHLPYHVSQVRPYLRSMSSMSEDEQKEFDNFCVIDEEAWKGSGIVGYINQSIIMTDGIDWLNSHHFDYRGLIKKGLALEVSEGMYKPEVEKKESIFEYLKSLDTVARYEDWRTAFDIAKEYVDKALHPNDYIEEIKNKVEKGNEEV